MLLENKVAVITGAGSGVGRAASLMFAANGAKIVACDIELAWVEETVRLIGADAVATRCDVRERSDLTAAVALAVSTFGRLDVMYNNAGVATNLDGQLVTFLDQREDEFERLMSVNYRGVVFGCQEAIAQFLAQGGGGAIVNTASVAGLVGFGGAIYGSTKGAVVQLTRMLAVEYARQDIRINSICPTGMLTNFGKRDGAGFAAPPQAMVERMGQLSLLGRPITPEDCANAAMFLASDMAANITGVNLPVDGGYSAA